MDIVLERILSLIPKKPDGKYVHGEKVKFAKNIGLKSGNVISDWENNRSKSYEDYIYEISAKYNVSVEWLKGETNIKEKAVSISGNGLSEIQQNMIDWVMNATPEQLQSLYDFLQKTK